MPPRHVKLLLTAGGSLLLCVLLIVLLPLPAATSPRLPVADPATPATPVETPDPQPTDWVRTTAYVTPSVTTLRAGESLTVTAEMVMTGTCDYPIYDVTLRASDALFAYIDPPTEVIGPPGPNPAVWKLRALQTGVTTFTVAFYGETYCDGVWQWHYTWGQSPAVTVISSSLSLPAIYRLMPHVPPPLPPPPPVVTDLGTLGGKLSVATDVNNLGWVVGSSTIYEDNTSEEWHAFLWQNGKMVDLGTLGGSRSYANHINDSGQIAGNSEFGAGDDEHTFFWENGRMKDIGTLGGAWSRVVDLNDLGQVIGVSSTAAGDTHCFLWAAGVMTDLGTLGGSWCSAADINNRGQIVGKSGEGVDDSYGHAFLWENGAMTKLTLSSAWDGHSSAVAINERGQVLGYGDGPDGLCFGLCGALWDNGAVIDLTYHGQGLERLDAVNDLGQVVGYGDRYVCPEPPDPYCDYLHGLLWDNGTLIDLGVRTGRWRNNPTLLNNRGQVVVDAGLVPALWHNGVLIPFELSSVIADTAGLGTAASAISESGLVVGYTVGGHALLWRIEPAAGQH
jgi:probable HAF family extracellular repeat protein